MSMPDRTARRKRFDALLDEEIAQLPGELADVLVRVPVIVENEPSAALLKELGPPYDEELCGLHWEGPVPEGPADLPERILLFRGPIWRLAQDTAHDRDLPFQQALRDEIHITLWHELGHAAGLDEDEIEELGYG